MPTWRRTKRQSQLLHELRVHIRLGPGRTEPIGEIKVVDQLFGLNRVRAIDSVPYENTATLLMSRCVEAGIPIDVVRRAIMQCRYR